MSDYYDQTPEQRRQLRAQRNRRRQAQVRRRKLLLGLLVLWITSFNQMMLSSVHQALADSRGIRVVWKNFLFTAAIAVVVTITMTWVGLLVINALLVLPGAAARNEARNLSTTWSPSWAGWYAASAG